MALSGRLIQTTIPLGLVLGIEQLAEVGGSELGEDLLQLGGGLVGCTGVELASVLVAVRFGLSGSLCGKVDPSGLVVRHSVVLVLIALFIVRNGLGVASEVGGVGRGGLGGGLGRGSGVRVDGALDLSLASGRLADVGSAEERRQ